MKKLLSLSLFLLLPLIAAAQTPGKVAPCYPTAHASAAQPAYVPHYFGQGNGEALGWFCPDDATPTGWRLHFRILWWPAAPAGAEELIGPAINDLAAASDKPRKLAEAEARWRTQPDCKDAPAGEYKNFCALAQGYFSKFWPAPRAKAAFVVGPATSADGTRPAYIFNGVTRGMAAGRATAGAPCDCAIKTNETTRYCGVNSRTDLVAVCVPAK